MFWLSFFEEKLKIIKLMYKTLYCKRKIFLEVLR